ncbi:Beta-lactamase OXA-1 precursor [Bordetella ansorpii]|uniref:Beta-lactamase n=1 Tax=Bordetella ansorpii TaxID=288768 RepID=A0A157SV46_9BORD|nr:class D beta-lactamase [Bordetella ansorpii]SAI74319.1 Beta-lactamase OXA-1 precursor [Bordetella ansorpii]
MIRRYLRHALTAALSCSALTALPASARMLCTLVADASDGRILVQQGTQGDCTSRYTPASSFKLPIALMGFDAGILQDAHTPTWSYESTYPDWGGEEWRKPADPERWIKYSIVWYSQQVARRLGQKRFQQYTTAFQYGNEDVSGDAGKHNGLDGAWIVSSLRVSPMEQIGFLRKLVNRRLPVRPEVYGMVEPLFEIDPSREGWHVYGKTGTGSPGDNGRYDREHAYGWFVGWARKDGRQVVFARLIQDEKATAPAAGLRARDQMLSQWAGMMAASARP